MIILFVYWGENIDIDPYEKRVEWLFPFLPRKDERINLDDIFYVLSDNGIENDAIRLVQVVDNITWTEFDGQIGVMIWLKNEFQDTNI
jgi:hypothetical protein